MVFHKHVSFLICGQHSMFLFVMTPSEAHYDRLLMDYTIIWSRGTRTHEVRWSAYWWTT